MWFTKLLILVTVFVTVNADGEKVLKIAQGTLRGVKTSTAYQNIPYFSFKGIPYAEPLVGPRKFDLARPAKPWQGVYDAVHHRQKCPQLNMDTFELEGEEDCLYLNVYTPANIKKGKCLPVMVWFYAGLFQLGSGDDDYYGPDFLIEKNVIVVTLNYRLGPLGFLNTEDGHAPGNMALKDQVLALKWIRDNIDVFGGCSDQVTIFGQSSGASAVNLHIMSPLSKGLFRAAIIQSSSATTWWSLSKQPRKDAFELGKCLGISTSDSKVLVDELKQKTTIEILNAVAYMYMEDEENEIGREDIFPFAPSVENDSGQEIFLPDDPWTILTSGYITDVPIIIGVTAEEAAIFPEEFLDDFIVPMLFDYLCLNLNVTDTAIKADIEDAMNEFYTDENMSSENKKQQTIEWISDMAVNTETLMTAKILAYRNVHPVFQYLFSYRASFGLLKAFFGSEYGAAHGDDLTYLFYSNKYRQKQNNNVSSQKMVDIMTTLWTNFARDLDPTLNKDSNMNFTWYPLLQDNWYLNIDLQPTMKKDLFVKNLKFWAPVYKEFLKEYAELFQ